MKILLINHYAGSPQHGMEYRPYYLAREWVRAGHSVRIVAAGYSHVRGKQPTFDGAAIRDRTLENIDGIEYIWYPAPPYQGNSTGRGLNIWAFLRQVWTDARRLVAESRPDVVIASSTYPLDIWVARRLARLAKAKLIYEVHDLWPLSPIELGGMSLSHPFIQLCQWAEHTAYRDADIVVSMLPNVHEHMASHGLDMRKLHIIPNGISPDDWQGEGQPINGELAEYMQAAHGHGNLIVGYAGAHGLPNALDTLLDAAKLLQDKPISFVLVGDGHEKVRLQRRVVDEGFHNVYMCAPISKAQIPSLLQGFDIAYIGLKSEPLFRFGVSPNKLMDYMMAARPILFAIQAGNDPVAEAACGLTVPPESPRGIADGLLKLAGLTAIERETMGLKGHAYVQAHNTYPVLAQKFLSIMTDVCNQGSITQSGAIRDIIEWDIANWSRALEFWKRNTSKDLSMVEALEIGSRNGGLSLWIALQGGRCLCTDLDGPTPAAVKMHRKYDVSQRIQYGMLDAAEMTYEAQFDIVFFKSVLGGIGYGNNKPKQQKAMEAIYRALKPGGELLFAENLMASPLHRFLRRHFVDWGEQWRYITLAELKQFTADFAEVKYSTVGFLGALGRTESQRNFLGRLDKVFVERMVPQKWRYIVIGVAKK